MSFGYGYGFRAGRHGRIGHDSAPSLRALIAQLFASGVPGGAWDFADPAALFQDAAGTMPVTAPDQPVARASDISGHGLHLTQPSAASRPLWTTLPNGRPAALFDGVDDFLSLAALDLTATDKVTVIAGARKMSDATTAMLVEFGPNASTTAGTFYLTGASSNGSPSYSGNIRGVSGNCAANSPLNYPAPRSDVLTMTGDLAAPQNRLYVSSALAVTSSAATGGGNFGNRPLFVGIRGGTVRPFAGFLTFVLVIGRVLSPEEIALVEAAINAQIAPPPPTLGTLTLSATSFIVGEAPAGTIDGATAGSTITASGLPAGLTIDSAARTWAWSGIGAPATGNLTLTETLAGATGSPRASVIGYTVSAGASARPTMDVTAWLGQSNACGRGDAALSPATADHYWTGSAITYPMVDPVPGLQGDGALTGSMLPAYSNAARALTARHQLHVQTARGGAPLIPAAGAGVNWSAISSLRGGAVTQINAAIAAVEASPDYTLGTVRLIWAQGEQDAVALALGTAGVTAEGYRDALCGLVDYLAASITGGIEGCYIVRLGNQNDRSGAEAWAAIRDAQEQVATLRPLAHIAYRGTASYPYTGMHLHTDQPHYGQDGLNMAGRATAAVVLGPRDAPVPARPQILQSWPVPDTSAATGDRVTTSIRTPAGTKMLVVGIALGRAGTSTNGVSSVAVNDVEMRRAWVLPSSSAGAVSTAAAARVDIGWFIIDEALYGGPLSDIDAAIVGRATATGCAMTAGIVHALDRPAVIDEGASAQSNADTPSLSIAFMASAPVLALGLSASAASAAAPLTHTVAGFATDLDAGPPLAPDKSLQAWAGHAALAEAAHSVTIAFSATAACGTAQILCLRGRVTGENL